MNPYEELDVPVDATDAEIKSAFRERAKRLHPDAGGDAEAFKRINLSAQLLLNPSKRRKYDKGGTADQDPDNTTSLAMQLLCQFVGQLVDDYIKGGFNPSDDPRKVDILGGFRAWANESIGELEVSKMKGAKTLAFLRDMAERFEEGSILRRGLRDRIQFHEAQIIEIAEGMEIRREARALAAKMQFRFDKATAEEFIQKFWEANSPGDTRR